MVFCVQKLEEHCLQDIMYRAVHASRQGQDTLFPILRKVRHSCKIYTRVTEFTSYILTTTIQICIMCIVCNLLSSVPILFAL